MPRIVESFEEFARRQLPAQWIMESSTIGLRTGDNFYSIVFSNGAVSDGNFNHADPPQDPQARVTRQRRFVVAALRQTEEAFQRYKNACLSAQANAVEFPDACPGAPSDSTLRLAQGKERIVALRKQLAEMDALLRDPQAEQRKEALAKQEQRQQQEAAKRLAELQSITI